MGTKLKLLKEAGNYILHNKIQNNKVSFIIEDDLIIFSGKSDSVQLICNMRTNDYYLEVMPIDPNLTIEPFNFTSEKSAIVAFTMWMHYMDVVVYEQFKNF